MNVQARALPCHSVTWFPCVRRPPFFSSSTSGSATTARPICRVGGAGCTLLMEVAFVHLGEEVRFMQDPGTPMRAEQDSATHPVIVYSVGGIEFAARCHQVSMFQEALPGAVSDVGGTGWITTTSYSRNKRCQLGSCPALTWAEERPYGMEMEVFFGHANTKNRLDHWSHRIDYAGRERFLPGCRRRFRGHIVLNVSTLPSKLRDCFRHWPMSCDSRTTVMLLETSALPPTSISSVQR